MAEEQESPEELRFAYDQLRKEILHNDVITIQILGFFIVFTGVVIGFSSSASLEHAFFMKAALFFSAECITFIGLLQGIDRGRSTCIMGSYLRVFVEPYMRHMRWEIRLQEFRRRNRLLGFFSYGGFTEYQMLFYTSLISIDLFLFSLNWWRLFDTSGIDGIFFSCSGIFILLVVTVACVSKAWDHYEHVVLNQDKSLTPTWREIELNESEGQTDIGIDGEN
jgi:hypothetical protein